MRKKRIGEGRRIAAIVIADLLAFGVSLCVFAYFHHVRQPKIDPVGLSTPPAAGDATPDPAQTTVDPNATVDPDATTDPDAAASSSPDPVDPNDLLGGKYADKFSTAGVVSDETCYRSEKVALEFRQEWRYDSLVHIIDIYIRDVHSLRTNLCQQVFGDRKSIQSLSDLLPGALAISSSDQYSNRNRSIWGLLVSNGLGYSSDTDIFDFAVLFLDGTMEVYEAGQADYDSLVERGIYQAWTFGPVLVKDGAVPDNYDGAPDYIATKNPRVAIGYCEPGHYYLVMVDGTRASESGSAGATLEELSALFLDLGCTQALNLDGGGTVAMSFGGRVLNTSSRNLSSAIYVCEPDAPDVGGNGA